MMDATKYAPGYYPVPAGYDSWVKKDHIEKAPAWCSVDLRDGNQALIVPMSLEEKLEFFQMLVKIGFKEIEVGFPAASDTEYEFLRTLIEKNMIPDDVTVQVLTQCRDHIIRKTFEAVKGSPRAVIHFYNSTSVAQREQVFHKSKEEIKKIATDGAKLVKQLRQEYEGNFLFEYSPESFTGTEVDYAVDVCNAVLVKGVRAARDFAYEANLAEITRRLGGEETLLLPASADYEHFSSTMAREMIRYGQPLEKYVPAPIAEELEKMRG